MMEFDCCWLYLKRFRQRIKLGGLFAARVVQIHLDIYFFSVPLEVCSVTNNFDTGL